MTSALPGQSTAPFKNRRGWLIAFGVFEILIACFCLLLMILMVVALTLAQFKNVIPSQQNQLSPAVQVAACVVVYGGTAALLLTIGVGSIRCRNWARIAMLAVSGIWLGVGALTTLVILLLIPRILEQQHGLSSSARQGVLWVMIVFMGIVMVVVPAIFLFFYSRKSVRATCLAHGMKNVLVPMGAETSAEGPTTKLPVPIIILALWQGMGVFAVFGFLVVKAIVVFGFVLHGTAAFLYVFSISALCGYAAWLIYRQKVLGWTIALFIALFGIGSTIATFGGHDMLQTYSEMGFTEQQLQAFRQFPQIQTIIWIIMIPSMTAYLAFLVYTRKFFPQSGS